MQIIFHSFTERVNNDINKGTHLCSFMYGQKPLSPAFVFTTDSSIQYFHPVKHQHMCFWFKIKPRTKYNIFTTIWQKKKKIGPWLPAQVTWPFLERSDDCTMMCKSFRHAHTCPLFPFLQLYHIKYAYTSAFEGLHRPPKTVRTHNIVHLVEQKTNTTEQQGM